MVKAVNSYAMLKAALWAASITGVALVTGCASSPNTDRAEIREAGDGFPSLDSNWHDGGRFVDPQNLLRIKEAQSKDQVRQLIGNPHFSEGFFGVREWNYVFSLYTGEPGGEYITCQYQVSFDDDMVLESTRWRDAQCSELLVPTENVEDQALVLSGDVLFDFDSAQLSLEGRRALERVGQSAVSEFARPGMTIVGYTDRLGREDYNLALSRDRADAVAGYLSRQGIDREDIRTEGLGEANPLVACPGSQATRSLTECLRPNRRVEITISELSGQR